MFIASQWCFYHCVDTMWPSGAVSVYEMRIFLFDPNARYVQGNKELCEHHSMPPDKPPQIIQK